MSCLWLPMAAVAQQPPTPEEMEGATIEEPAEEFIEEEPPLDEGFSEDVPVEEYDADAEFQDNTNPLNPAGDSLERLVEMQISEDLWSAMLGELPCLDVSESCIRELQEMAVINNPTLAEIDARVEAINQKIEEARSNNQRSITMSIFEPLVEDITRIEAIQRVADPSRPPTPGSVIVPEERGFLENILDIFVNPVRGVNTVLSLIGMPLFRGISGGSDAQQNRQIAIADLQVKVAEVERHRAEMANDLREEVLLQALQFETFRREFQGYQEMGRRSTLRLEVLTTN
ncbi:MAG: hypothetical protein HC881_15990, partial [Leptolyngbyaceae cyanobacterium SL_7_1]|nr:hypothetical protein [Leptolyngbyaceae cyanobacterium SL_7_1]